MNEQTNETNSIEHPLISNYENATENVATETMQSAVLTQATEEQESELDEMEVSYEEQTTGDATDNNNYPEIMVCNEAYCTCNKAMGPRAGKIQCKASDSNKWCPGWEFYHTTCMNISDEDADNIERYICPICSIRTGEQIQYKTTSDGKTAEKYEVEKIT